MEWLVIGVVIGLAAAGVVSLMRKRKKKKSFHLHGAISWEVNRGDAFPPEGVRFMPTFDLHDGKKVLYTPAATDSEGNPVAIEAGSLTGTSSDSSLVEVTSDGNTATISTVPGPGLGTATVTFTADADLGEGVAPVSEEFTVNVIAGQASTLAGTIGAEEDR